MSLLHNVQDYIQAHDLLLPGEQVVVGVSGGPDSVALLHLLMRLAHPPGVEVHVAHLHHGIRGTEADADAEFVAALAQTWELPYTIQHTDLPTLAKQRKLTLEEAARRYRYAFLSEVAREVGATKVAVGHNANDQAETVLMHLLRGAGPSGLRGMLPIRRLRDYRLLPGHSRPPDSLQLVRPLLSTSRQTIENYVQEHRLETRFDHSNLDTTYFRNQLRHEVLPYLEEINPQISERLQNLAEVVRADYSLIQEFVSVAWDTLLVESHADALVFDLWLWREQYLAVRRALVRGAVYRLRRTLRDVDFEHVENAVQLAQEGVTGMQATLPRGLVLTVGYTTLTISDVGALHLPPERPWLEPGNRYWLNLSGVTELPGGWTVYAQPRSQWDLEAIVSNPNPLTAWIDATALGDKPVLRTRQPGDRFHPLGMEGQTVKLSDLLINAKVPQAWRDYIPLLEARGEILWVIGVRLSEKALVDTETGSLIYLRFRGPKV